MDLLIKTFAQPKLCRLILAHLEEQLGGQEKLLDWCKQLPAGPIQRFVIRHRFENDSRFLMYKQLVTQVSHRKATEKETAILSRELPIQFLQLQHVVFAGGCALGTLEGTAYEDVDIFIFPQFQQFRNLAREMLSFGAVKVNCHETLEVYCRDRPFLQLTFTSSEDVQQLLERFDFTCNQVALYCRQDNLDDQIYVCTSKNHDYYTPRKTTLALYARPNLNRVAKMLRKGFHTINLKKESINHLASTQSKNDRDYKTFVHVKDEDELVQLLVQFQHRFVGAYAHTHHSRVVDIEKEIIQRNTRLCDDRYYHVKCDQCNFSPNSLKRKFNEEEL